MEAVAWAFRQQLPPKPKILLLTLADQTDERTGKVVYGKVDADHLAIKSSVSRRSFFRYVAALIRNGYMRRESGQTNGHENEYWLCLDRAPTEVEEWQWGKDLEADDAEDGDEAQDVGEGHAKLAHPPNGPNWHGGRAIGGTAKESLENQRTSRAREKPLNSFSRDAQDVAVTAAAPKPPDPNERVFVIEGTRWWAKMTEWWRKTHGRPINQTYAGEGQFRGKTGRHFRRADLDAALKTGPPPLSDENSAELQKTG